MFEFYYERKFFRKYKKLVKSNHKLEGLIDKKLNILSNFPVDPKLGTHKVFVKDYGWIFSSRINGDLRIIWDYSDKDIRIISLLDIGGHDGGSGVY